MLICVGFWTRLSCTFWFDLSLNYWLILLLDFGWKIVSKAWIFRFYVERLSPGIWSRSWISIAKALLHYSDLLTRWWFWVLMIVQNGSIQGFRLWILNLLRMIKRSFGTVLYSQILQIRLMLFILQWLDVRIRVLCIANVLLVMSLIVFAMPFSCGGSNHLCKKNLRGLKAIRLIDHKGLRGIGRGTITYCLCYSSKNSYCTRNLKNTISIMSIVIYNVQLRFFTLPYCTGDLAEWSPV